MFIEIVRHTPGWVWGLFFALVVLGVSQARDRQVGLGRLTVLPLVMLGLSLSGVFSAFGHFPVALGGWAIGLAAALAFGRHLITTRGTEWVEATARVHVPGSWLPLGLMLGLFSFKYFAGVSLALHADLSGDPAFAGPVSLAYGALSGLLLARGLALRRVAPTRMRLARI